MSDCYMWAQDGFTSGEEQNLYKSPLTTVWRHQWSTEPGLSKQSSPGFPTPKSQLESGPPLDQSNSLSMSIFDDLDSQFSFEFTLKPKFSMTATQPDGPAGQGNVESSTSNNQNNPSESDVNKQIELTKLRVQQLQLKLQIKRLAAGLNLNLNPPQRMSTLPVQFIWFDDRVNNYKKEVAFKNSRLTFKLEETHNYNVW